jgi:sugar lactone lactonase YvrE
MRQRFPPLAAALAVFCSIGMLRAWAAPSYVALPATPVGQSSPAQSVTFSFASAATVSGVAVLFQGAPNLDFTSSANTCVGSHTKNATCAVSVVFTPRALGTRLGAVELLGAGSAILQTVFISGIGTGPGVTFNPSSMVSIGSGFGYPDALAFDGYGNLYIGDYPADSSTGRGVVELPLVNGALSTANQKLVGSGLNYVDGLAIDGAGNLFVSDYDENKVLEVPASGGPNVILLQNAGANTNVVYNPAGLTVDGAGDLYVCDYGNNRVIEIPNQNGALNPAAAIDLGSGLSAPSGVKVDAAGNLIVADFGNARVVEIPNQNGALSTAAQITLVNNLPGMPSDLALDPAGDLYVTMEVNGGVEVIPNSNGTYDPAQAYLLAQNQNDPDAIALDGAGNVYFCDTYDGLVYQLNMDPTALNFGSVGVGQTSAPQTTPVLSYGNQPLSINSIQFGALFPNQGSTCTGNLNPGDRCDLIAAFAPNNLGPVTQSAVISDNAVNQPLPTQSVSMSGTGVQGAQTITFSVSGPLSYGIAPFPVVATGGGSGNPVVLALQSGPASLSGNTLTVTGVGAIVLTATQAGNALYLPGSATLTLTVVQGVPAVTWTPAIPTTFPYGSTLAPILDASTPVAGTWTYKLGGAPVNASIVPPVGTWQIEAAFTPADATDYASVNQNLNITVQPAVLRVIAANQTMQQGAAVPPLTYTITGFQSTDSAALITGAPVLSTSATPASAGGVYPINVSVAGMSAENYTFLAVPGQLTVNGVGPQAQTIAFPPLAPVTWIGAPVAVALNATASSGLPVSYTVSGPATLSGSTLTVVGVGTVTVTASQSGDANFVAATPVTQSFVSSLPYFQAQDVRRDLDLDNMQAAQEIWFAATGSARGITDGTVIAFQDGQLAVTANGATKTYATPNAIVVFSAAAPQPSSVYDASSNTWSITLPLAAAAGFGAEDHAFTGFHSDGHPDGNDGGNAWFIDGFGLPASAFAGLRDAQVDWSGVVSSNRAGLNLRWRWRAAAYSQWAGDDNALGVQLVRAALHGDRRGDAPGTPQAFERYRLRHAVHTDNGLPAGMTNHF